MNVYRNIGLTAFAILTIALLVFFGRDQEEKTHVFLPIDTSEQQTGEEELLSSGKVEGESQEPAVEEMQKEHGLPVNRNMPVSEEKVKSENFMGKSFSQCMEMVYAWPDAQVFHVDDDNEGIEVMRFVVNKHHHELSFENGICQVDEIVKK